MNPYFIFKLKERMKKKFYKKTLILIFGGAVLFTSFGFKSDFFEIAKQIEIFTTLFKEINMNYVDETSPADLMDTAIKSMLTDLDPYTNFWSEQDVQSSRINMEGEYTGIGAALKQDEDVLLITEVYKDYPADKAGLKPGDKITKIGNTKVSDFTEGGFHFQVVSLIQMFYVFQQMPCRYPLVLSACPIKI